MKYLQSIKNYYYSEEKKDSGSQIMEDFGGFLPSPLCCENLSIEFVIVKIRKIGGVYANLLMFNRLINVKETSEIHESIHGVWNEISAVKTQLKSQFQSFVESTRTKTKMEMVLFVVVLLPLICLLAPIVVPVLAFKISSILINVYRRMPKGMGYFIPLFFGETRIVINVGTIDHRNDINSIISHEHLHLLQHRNSEFSNKNSRCNDILLNGDLKGDKFLLYLLERNEVEARLHEIVISYYGISNSLPLTMEGFVDFLAGSNQFGPMIIKAMGLDETAIEQRIVKYCERNAVVAEHVEITLLAISDNDLRRRFIIEVLSVMYGNLIKYYGDKQSSLNFLSKIERPNLYDMLYA